MILKHLRTFQSIGQAIKDVIDLGKLVKPILDVSSESEAGSSCSHQSGSGDASGSHQSQSGDARPATSSKALSTRRANTGVGPKAPRLTGSRNLQISCRFGLRRLAPRPHQRMLGLHAEGAIRLSTPSARLRNKPSSTYRVPPSLKEVLRYSYIHPPTSIRTCPPRRTCMAWPRRNISFDAEGRIVTPSGCSDRSKSSFCFMVLL